MTVENALSRCTNNVFKKNYLPDDKDYNDWSVRPRQLTDALNPRNLQRDRHAACLFGNDVRNDSCMWWPCWTSGQCVERQSIIVRLPREQHLDCRCRRRGRGRSSYPRRRQHAPRTNTKAKRRQQRFATPPCTISCRNICKPYHYITSIPQPNFYVWDATALSCGYCWTSLMFIERLVFRHRNLLYVDI